jgi:hypothetical protein
VRLDPASWGRPQPATAEILSLLVPDASADTVEEYAEICRRVLTDGELADRVARRQLELLEPLLDLGAYWDAIRRQYETWLETQPATTASQAT